MIIRKKIVSGINTEIIRLSNDENIEKIIDRIGKEKFLKHIFKEEESYCFLLQEYKEFINGKESEYFSWIYPITPKYGVILDSHIYIYKIITRMFIVLLNLNFVKRFFTKNWRHLERNAASFLIQVNHPDASHQGQESNPSSTPRM